MSWKLIGGHGFQVAIATDAPEVALIILSWVQRSTDTYIYHNKNCIIISGQTGHELVGQLQ